MRTRMIAEIISSVLCRRLRVAEGVRSAGRSRGSDCFGRAMSKAVVFGEKGLVVGRLAEGWRNTYVDW